MRRGLVFLGAASVLALGCGEDSMPVPIDDDSSTGTPMTTTTTMGVDPTTGIDPSATSSPATDGTTGDTGSDTAMVDSSTGPVAVCGNDVIEEDEICDGTDLAGADCVAQGFDDGDLGCLADCSGYDTQACVNYNCGNGVLEGKEACDGMDLGGATCESEGFDSGTIGCGLNCGALDTSDCGTCGNVIVDGDEVCDTVVFLGQTCESQGYSSGQIGCSPDCLSYDFANCIQCGNDLIDGIEPCDGIDLGGETCVTQGFVGGVLSCDPDCGAFDTTACNSCGNDIIDAGESCDGMNLGGNTCASLGLVGGTLSCDPFTCQYDFSACDIPGLPFGSDSGYNGYVIQGAPLPCDDISATGVGTGLTDDSYTSAPVGFNFNMYGMPFNTAFIASNGSVYFGTDANLNLSNVCMPADTPYVVDNDILAVFWDDLNPGAAGDVLYQTLGPVGDQRFVVQWETAFFGGDLVDLIRVQAMFHENGAIEVCYTDTTSLAHARNNGAQATSGIQHSPTDGFQYSCNAPNLTAGTLLLYIPI